MSEKRYVSYFQSVITIGILTSANNIEEAEKRASKKFKDEDGVNHCFFEQSPFEASDTEEWNAEFESTEGEGFKFNPSEETRNIIATRMQKDVSELTEDDLESFIKGSIENSLRA